MKLAIVVGHSKDKQGARAASPLNKTEYEYNLEVAEFVFRFAMDYGIFTRIFLRDKVGIVGAYKAVQDWAKDGDTVCVELHFNAFNKKAKGTETLFDQEPSDSIELARAVHTEVIECFKRKGKDDRGLKLIDEGRGAKSLAECKIPGCLIEPFFGDNPDEAYMGQKMKIEYAHAIVDGVKTYFEHRQKAMSLN
jgi:N-acetylmuramoyl-L-alanine amidase